MYMRPPYLNTRAGAMWYMRPPYASALIYKYVNKTTKCAVFERNFPPAAWFPPKNFKKLHNFKNYIIIYNNMAFTIVTVAEMQFMAGENVDATGDVTANHQFLHDYAVAYLSALLKFDLLANWTGISANYKFLFTEWAARLAGVQLVSFNMNGYATSENTARIHAEDIINIHIFRMNEIEKLLNKSDVQDFLET